MTVALKIENMDKSFPGVQALKNVSITIEKGFVHALVGENGAGKSTLIKILGGVYQPDNGKIFLSDSNKGIVFDNPAQAIRAGISIIYQELNLVPTLSVAENIFLGKEISGKRKNLSKLDRKMMYEQADSVLKLLDINMDVTKNVDEYSIAKQQLVEIGKALLNNSSILIMDEPTAVLTGKETNALFTVCETLLQKGITIIFVSHRLEEVIKIADMITVLRDGQVITTLNNKNRCQTKNEIVKYMVGRELTDYYPPATKKHGDDIVLESKSLTKAHLFSDICFKLYKGEILGFSGLIGAGRTELALALFGYYKVDSGEVYINSKELQNKKITDSVNAGITLVPEDRKNSGLILGMTLEENVAIPNKDLISTHGIISKSRRRNLAIKTIDELSIRPITPTRSMLDFSGGNQQKVVIGKWLATKPKVLIMDEPTRGVDVGAKAEIYKLMRNLTQQGVSIIFISSEMPELLGMCDRILVMHEGTITGEFNKNEFDQQKIMVAATGVID